MLESLDTLKQKPSKIKRFFGIYVRRYIRTFFTSLTIFLLITLGTLWILNDRGIIRDAWLEPLSIGFAILGVLFTFLQWAVPLPQPVTEEQVYDDLLRQVNARLTTNLGV